METRLEIFFTRLILSYCFFTAIFIRNCNGFNCHFPDGCRFEMVYNRDDPRFYERSNSKILAAMCDVKNEMFEFNYIDPKSIKTGGNNKEFETCLMKPLIAIFRSVSSELTIWDKRFNFANVIRYFKFLNHLMESMVLKALILIFSKKISISVFHICIVWNL